MRAIGYVRVSTQEQHQEGISLEYQERQIGAYCALRGFEQLEIIADPGQSGKNLQRRGIRSIIEAVKAGEVGNVIVVKLDRLSRKTKDTLQLIEDFEDHGVSFHSIKENIDTKTALGNFFLTIMSALAQMERDLIAERTKDVLAHKKEKGEWLGKPPIGYRYNGESKKLEEDEEGMKLIRKAKRLHRRGLSMGDISKRLNLGKSTISRLLKDHLTSYKNRYINHMN